MCSDENRSDRCKRFVNVNRQGGFGLRSLLASATVENQAMDKQQVARAQKKLDTNFAGKGLRAALIYEVFNENATGSRPSTVVPQIPNEQREKAKTGWTSC
ncbi:unnamed protein product [Durusdinium trenchii]|uniref:Uncharacterized protein n=1 Tax=Durusdinium trenchii TaxID=1381693 RepID=A0ABP0R2E5_9DINO